MHRPKRDDLTLNTQNDISGVKQFLDNSLLSSHGTKGRNVMHNTIGTITGRAGIISARDKGDLDLPSLKKATSSNRK